MKKTWYYNTDLKPVGPVTLQEVRAQIHAGQIGPHDLICDEDQQEGRWQAASEFKEFEQGLFPSAQSYIPGVEVDELSADWVLLIPEEGTMQLRQQGPYSMSEVAEMFFQGKILASHHIWKSGLSGWSRLSDRPEFKKIISPSL